METHVKLAAAFNIALGIFGVIGAIFVLVIFGGAAGVMGFQGEKDAAMAVPILGAFGVGLFILILALSVPSIIAGVGLLKHRQWARVLTIVISVLNLLNIPFGTVVGAYSLWVMLSRDTERLFSPGQPGTTVKI
ncbi:MAG TPA: hypothetical protein VGK99_20010 [Acidobacteriota bacterium]|jgi:hypothetical protein